MRKHSNKGGDILPLHNNNKIEPALLKGDALLKYEKTLLMENIYAMILHHIGENTQREGLVETPRRHLKFLKEFTSPKPVDFTVFDAEGQTEMVVVSKIPFYSLCEHHIVPFFGEAVVGYLPNQKIVGLSKIPRAVEFCAHRLQNQERITKEVAELIDQHVQPLGVGVILTGRHMCMEMRGVRCIGATTTTSHFTGEFNLPSVREEFYRKIQLQK